MPLIKLVIISTTLFLISCATKETSKTPAVELAPAAFVSRAPIQPILIDHKVFQIYYDQDYRLPKYVVYTITAEKLKNHVAKRRDRFFEDPLLKKSGRPTAKPAEYKRSGYDQGHMAPSADFAWSQEANDLTFVMSNMAPQTPNLNRNAWRLLEDQVRKWACGEERITVITGPILEPGLPKLKSGLPIPKQFFKVVIDKTPPEKVIAFIYNQTDTGNIHKSRIVSLAQIKDIPIADYTQKKDKSILRIPSSLEEWKEKDCDK